MLISLSANSSWYLYNFRFNLVQSLIDEGHEIALVAPDDQHSNALVGLGCSFFLVPLDSKGMNPLNESKSLFNYLSLYRKIRPDVALHFTIKPIIYGSLASMFLGIPSINTVTGLGTGFLSGRTIRLLTSKLLKVALCRSNTTVFQNESDRSLFLAQGIVNSNSCFVVSGSGVDLNYFSLADYSESISSSFLLASRLLWDKGVGEFVEAATLIKQRGLQARFILAGPIGVSNRTAIPKETIDDWCETGIVEYWGVLTDIRTSIASAACVVLPSYREGLSRILLEACSMGRPIISTDVPGCRDIVEHGVNGFLCQPKDAESLAEAMQRFLQLSTSERRRMATNSRIIGEKRFDQAIVNSFYKNRINVVCSKH